MTVEMVINMFYVYYCGQSTEGQRTLLNFCSTSSAECRSVIYKSRSDAEFEELIFFTESVVTPSSA